MDSMCVITPSIQIKHIYCIKKVKSAKHPLFFPQQMLTPAPLNENLISNHTMKNCKVRF